MDRPVERYRTDEASMLGAVASFWATYYDRLRAAHLEQGRAITQPVEDRNLQTTSAGHVRVFERFWGDELANALGVPRASVGPAKIQFTPYRSKNFDVCYPLEGEPKILISIKSMQNAYRNITNRVEEALGDSSVLRIYDSQAAFGFFYFVLDGPVARGGVPQGIWPVGERVVSPPPESETAEDEVVEEVDAGGGTKRKKIAPYLTLIEQGGDFFDLGNIDAYRKVAKPTKSGKLRAVRETARKDEISDISRSLMDLVQKSPSVQTNPKYDAMSLLPATIARADGAESSTWDCRLSPVDPLLDYRPFIERLVATARVRGLL